MDLSYHFKFGKGLLKILFSLPSHSIDFKLNRSIDMLARTYFRFQSSGLDGTWLRKIGFTYFLKVSGFTFGIRLLKIQSLCLWLVQYYIFYLHSDLLFKTLKNPMLWFNLSPAVLFISITYWISRLLLGVCLATSSVIIAAEWAFN